MENKSTVVYILFLQLLQLKLLYRSTPSLTQSSTLRNWKRITDAAQAYISKLVKLLFDITLVFQFLLQEAVILYFSMPSHLSIYTVQ